MRSYLVIIQEGMGTELNMNLFYGLLLQQL